MIRPALALLAPLALSACIVVAPGADVPATMPAADECGAAAILPLVGQPASVLSGMTLPADTRVITPGMAVTMDFRANRMNIMLDDAGMIESVTCG
ncbi:MAG: hypothetical protein IT542_04315 [Rubellimicrobium sp.]|nr:hypothetical protein [Rubellimicrobium sp.]